METQIINMVLDQLKRIEHKIDNQASTCSARLQHCNQCASDKEKDLDDKLETINEKIDAKADMDFVKWVITGATAALIALGGFMLGVSKDVQALQKDLVYLHPGQIQKGAPTEGN